MQEPEVKQNIAASGGHFLDWRTLIDYGKLV